MVSSTARVPKTKGFSIANRQTVIELKTVGFHNANRKVGDATGASLPTIGYDDTHENPLISPCLAACQQRDGGAGADAGTARRKKCLQILPGLYAARRLDLYVLADVPFK